MYVERFNPHSFFNPFGAQHFKNWDNLRVSRTGHHPASAGIHFGGQWKSEITW
jgi:hypothetical protein